jgi:microcystin-dependent protein
MSYEIDRSDKANYGSIRVEDGTIDFSTSLQFIGKNYTGYAKVLAENFLHLLENFAKSTPPPNPIPGQLWYDTNLVSDPPQPQLKIWSGTAWSAAGNIKKSISRPISQDSVIGDLWVDTANQQLYLWSGSNWILVGPQYSDNGLLSGPAVESIIDTVNVPHSVIKMYLKNEVVSIISTDSFTPKAAIEGFITIKPGINVSNKDFNGDGIVDNKVWGTAEKADSLLVGNVAVPSSNFLRGDVVSNTNFGINIRNNAGIAIGSDLTTTISNTASGEAIIYNKTEGSRLFLRVNVQGAAKDVITISTTRVGINKNNPESALDVNGTARVSENLNILGTTESTSLLTGSLTTAGGAAITRNLNVGQDVSIGGTTTLGTVLPKTAGTFDLGSTSRNWRHIYANEITANTFYGQFSGQFQGSVTGTASRLSSATAFSIIGDVTSNTVNFTGQQADGTVVFNTLISQEVITSKQEVPDFLSSDELLINRSGLGLRKITKQTAFSSLPTMPVGAILPFAGSTPPPGYLLCDGSEQLISTYPALFSVIGYTYKPFASLLGLNTFAVPDLRGRFGLGKENMNNNTTVASKTTGATITTITSPAGRVTDEDALVLGGAGGSEDTTLTVSNLPDHAHDLQGSAGGQYYAFRNVSGTPTDTDAIPGNGPTGALTGQYLDNSGGIDTTSPLAQPTNVLNPFLSINYIIFTGKI